MVLRWRMAGKALSRSTPGLPDTEKVTVNLGFVDLGQIDLLVKEGFYSNRTDCIRSAIRHLILSHGDVAGIEGSRRSLCDWLDWMGLIDAGRDSQLDRMIGYYEPYATSHATLDRDTAVQDEVRNVGRAVTRTVTALRGGELDFQRHDLPSPRPK